MHEKTANEWNKVISVTVAYIGDRQKANEFVEKYLKSVLSLTPKKVFDERAGISSWEEYIRSTSLCVCGCCGKRLSGSDNSGTGTMALESYSVCD